MAEKETGGLDPRELFILTGEGEMPEEEEEEEEEEDLEDYEVDPNNLDEEPA